jgi:hypothetical protein
MHGQLPHFPMQSNGKRHENFKSTCLDKKQTSTKGLKKTTTFTVCIFVMQGFHLVLLLFFPAIPIVYTGHRRDPFHRQTKEREHREC